MGNSKKKRVFQIAREFNMSNEALISFLEKLNFSVRNHMSVITDKMYEEVVGKYSLEADISEKEFDFRRTLKEKRAREEEKKLEAQRKYEEKVRTSILIMSEKPRKRKIADGVSTSDLPPTGEEEEVATIEPKEPVTEVSQIEHPAVTTPPEILEKDEDKILKDAEEAVQELIATKKQELKKQEIQEKKEERKKKKVKKDEKLKKGRKFKKTKEVTAEKEKNEEKSPQISEKVSEEKVDVERELELKVIRKIEASKGKRTETVTAEKHEKKAARKKLKAKERKAEIADEEVEHKKKKKKKKQVRQVETTEVKKDKFKRKSKKRKKIQISEAEVEESIKQTLVLMEESGKTKKRKKKLKVDGDTTIEEDNILKVHEFVTVAELAAEMDVEPSDVIKKCLELGILVSINHRLDEAIILSVADEFDFDVELIPEFGSEKFEEIEEKDDETFAETRSPVVTIMGHVDHGKTSLLDYIRESNITHGESGGITQHIGAYEVRVDGKSITFLDTPGHEAFTAMRARGAQATDIVILVVAADDSVMPQTIEAINHSKAANVPIIVAINKIDKSNANVEIIKKQLAEQDVLIESWGGKYQSIEISAKTGAGIDKLLESILVEAEMLELKANPNRLASGVIIESRLDKGKGVIATVLVQKGKLKIGDPFIAGQYSGKVRSIYDDQGKKRKTAGPSKPVMVLGFSGLPQAGDGFMVLGSEKDTKEISLKRKQIKREQEFRRIKHITLDEISRRIKHGQVKELSIVLKGDVDGSVEAISDSLTKLSNDEVAVRIVHKGVGAISESDVLLASASEAIIIGFQVRPTIKAREIAQRENIDIRLYKVIYNAISEIKDALEGLLEPEYEEKSLSVIEVRELFRVPKAGLIAGCYVMSGKILRNDKAKLFREDKLIYDGKITSLKRFKDDAKEVMSGFECGISLDGFDDIKINDIIETYKVEEIKRTLTLQK